MRQYYASWILSRPWQPRRGIVGYEEHSRRSVRMRSRPLHTCLSRARFLVKLWVRIKNFFVFKFLLWLSARCNVSVFRIKKMVRLSMCQFRVGAYCRFFITTFMWYSPSNDWETSVPVHNVRTQCKECAARCPPEAVVKVRGAQPPPCFDFGVVWPPLLESEPSLPTAGPKLLNSIKNHNVRCRINKF